MTPAQSLCRFVDDSPAPLLAALTLSRALESAGFKRLSLTAPRWELSPGGWFVQRGAAVIAFRLRSPSPKRFSLIGAHTDSPHLRLKPRAAYVTEGVLQLGVEVYGGALWNSWLDRDLGLAGAVYTADGEAHALTIRRPVARVSQLAIHLDRKANDEGLKLNPQLHLAPMWGLAASGADAQRDLDLALARAAGVDPSEVCAYDVSLFDVTPSSLGGAHDEFVFAARLDNLASCHAGLTAMLDAADGDPDAAPVLACFDHEEIGSSSLDGADGTLLDTVLERVSLALGVDRAGHLAALASSLMLSADMAHALHPNYVDRHEPRHRPAMGAGPVLKSNANQRYATSGPTAAKLRGLAKRADVPLQDFVTRTDLGCGSTIGPITASRLGVPVVDLGAPMLSMHSARECCAAEDHARYCALLTAHLRS
ncbi:MAG: M18 family aminopeptidase [Polyangiales bacterium]